MNKLSINILFVLIFTCQISAHAITISGFVFDKISKEPIVGANIYNPQTLKGTNSNQFGFYSFTVKEATELNLKISFVGYKNIELFLNLKTDSTIDVLMEPGKLIDEVNIIGEKYDRTQINAPSTISSKQISLMPSLTGEPDLMKAFQLLPGISGGNEGDNNLYVRGGSPDQNLILLDDVPLYYVNHIGGLVSIFDENAIKDMAIYKSGFPARYGGRLSSVVDVRMKNGNMQQFHGEASIGLISSKIFLEGPIIKDKASFTFTARKSMTDLYMIPISYIAMGKLGYVDYAFYDVNAKVNYKLSDKSRFYLSFYNGADKVLMNANLDSKDEKLGTLLSGERNKDFSFEALSKFGWGNTMGCLRWNKVYSSKLFSNLTLAITHYRFQNRSNNEIKTTETNLASETYIYDFNSGVNDKLAKLDFDFYPNSNHHIRFGGTLVDHWFNTGNLYQYYDINQNVVTDSTYIRTDLANEIDTTYGAEPIRTLESTFYIEDDWELSKTLVLNAGLHFANYKYQQQNFSSLQPRFSLLYRFGNGLSGNVSYTKMVQFIHMLTGSDTSTPTDIWLPVTDVTPPEYSSQYAIGFDKKLTNPDLSFKIEAYYKTMDNLIDYKLGYSLMNSNENWYEKIETGGKGIVYGVEFLMKKETGKLTGWLAYTYSRNTRTFANINNGVTFPYVYDRPHDLSLVANYELTERITLSGTWEYSSGRRMTIGTAVYDANVVHSSENLPKHGYNYYMLMDTYLHQFTDFANETATIYGTKNNYKLDDFHKLNISVHFKKQKRHGVRCLTVGIQNVYNRMNPYNVYYEYQKDGSVNLKKITLFPIMPNVSYSFKF